MMHPGIQPHPVVTCGHASVGKQHTQRKHTATTATPNTSTHSELISPKHTTQRIVVSGHAMCSRIHDISTFSLCPFRSCSHAMFECFSSFPFLPPPVDACAPTAICLNFNANANAPQPRQQTTTKHNRHAPVRALRGLRLLRGVAVLPRLPDRRRHGPHLRPAGGQIRPQEGGHPLLRAGDGHQSAGAVPLPVRAHRQPHGRRHHHQHAALRLRGLARHRVQKARLRRGAVRDHHA
mmetsp:Transcript_22993/g.65159  ORF Transcript_22993/g.65159 Transcript_22993/m.65159 type:complete len:236 (-) Transcript_22993:1785-2492(-)